MRRLNLDLARHFVLGVGFGIGPRAQAQPATLLFDSRATELDHVPAKLAAAAIGSVAGFASGKTASPHFVVVPRGIALLATVVRCVLESTTVSNGMIARHYLPPETGCMGHLVQRWFVCMQGMVRISKDPNNQIPHHSSLTAPGMERVFTKVATDQVATLVATQTSILVLSFKHP